jgi:hypothetical protein
MRGRIWWLWGCQTTAGVLCVGLGLANNSFAHTLVVLCFFSFFVEVRSQSADAHSRLMFGVAHISPLRLRPAYVLWSSITTAIVRHQIR